MPDIVSFAIGICIYKYNIYYCLPFEICVINYMIWLFDSLFASDHSLHAMRSLCFIYFRMFYAIYNPLRNKISILKQPSTLQTVGKAWIAAFISPSQQQYHLFFRYAQDCAKIWVFPILIISSVCFSFIFETISIIYVTSKINFHTHTYKVVSWLERLIFKIINLMISLVAD